MNAYYYRFNPQNIWDMGVYGYRGGYMGVTLLV